MDYKCSLGKRNQRKLKEETSDDCDKKHTKGKEVFLLHSVWH